LGAKIYIFLVEGRNDMALPPMVLWAGAAVATAAVAGAGVVYWIHANLGAPTLPAITERIEAPARAPANPPVSPPGARPSAQETAAREPSPAASPAAIKPAFDIVNVSPAGETVVAGRAAPNARVELRDGGRLLASATADASGQFVIIPDPLPPGSHELSLATGEGASAESSNPIVVAVVEPPKAASPPPAPAAGSAPPVPPAGPLPAIAVKSVEVGPGGRFVAKGEAAPNATVRLYLSGAFVGDAKTKADGRWSLTIEHGMTQGAYKVRADEVRPDGSVQARAEAPFDFPLGTPGDNVVASAAPSSPSDVVLASVQTAHVQPGDTLWGLSQTFYGDGSRYKLIFDANTGQIRDPNLIYPKQMFVVPKPEAKADSKP
jgi:LysM repeat protein